MHALVVGSGMRAAAEAAAKLPGVAKVLRRRRARTTSTRWPSRSPRCWSSLAPSLRRTCWRAATAIGKNVMPRVAALLDVQPISDISGVEDADTFVRPDLRRQRARDGQVVGHDQGDHGACGEFRSGAGGGRQRADREVRRRRDAKRLPRSSGAELSKSERPELTAARVVDLRRPRHAERRELQQLLEPIADKLGAAVGASRAAVDAGFVPNDYQVGQTGKIVAPELYIAVGISGAIQHLAGMKDSKVIVAINKDEEAPIFQVADYGLVARSVPGFARTGSGTGSSGLTGSGFD